MKQLSNTVWPIFFTAVLFAMLLMTAVGPSKAQSEAQSEAQNDAQETDLRAEVEALNDRVSALESRITLLETSGRRY